MKNKKEIMEDFIAQESEALEREELIVRFFQRKVVNDKNFYKPLAEYQSTVDVKKDFVDFNIKNNRVIYCNA